MSALLEARGIGRRSPVEGPDVEGGWLLREVSFAVAAGERVAIAGPTGAGKTLLLRSLALLDPVDEGEIRWRGEPIPDTAVPAYRRRAIYLHQRPALVEGTVEINLRQPFGFAVGKDGYNPDHVRDLLSAVSRDEAFLAKRTQDLSGGEAQITALLRALQLAPLLLLLDEPTAALDREAASAIERLVQSWFSEHERERALVWVSHDPEQAGRMTTRAVRLSAGRLAA